MTSDQIKTSRPVTDEWTQPGENFQASMCIWLREIALQLALQAERLAPADNRVWPAAPEAPAPEVFKRWYCRTCKRCRRHCGCPTAENFEQLEGDHCTACPPHYAGRGVVEVLRNRLEVYLDRQRRSGGQLADRNRAVVSDFLNEVAVDCQFNGLKLDA